MELLAENDVERVVVLEELELKLDEVDFLGKGRHELMNLIEEHGLFAAATFRCLQRLQTHNSVEQVVSLRDLRTNFGIRMLSKGRWWVIALMHVLQDILEEEVRSEEGRLFG